MYGSKISSIRQARGYSQAYVAKKIGMNQQQYSKIEHDKKAKVDDELLAKIAESLGVSVEDIKSPTPIIMSFHDSPYSGQYTTNHNNIDTSIIESFKQQLQQKDEQITQLLAIIGKK